MHYYTEQHEWVSLEKDNEAKIGITRWVKNQLSNVIYIELPQVNQMLNPGNIMAVIESIKTAREIFCPITCQVHTANKELEKNPDIMKNTDDHIWFVTVKILNPQELETLMNEESYSVYLSSLSSHK